MLVDVVLLLKDVVEVPHLDASVNGACEHGVLCFRYQGLDLDDPLWNKSVELKGTPIEIGNLEVSYQPLDQTSSVHVPHDDLLPDA